MAHHLDFVDQLAETAAAIEAQLNTCLPPISGPEGQIAAAMRHAALAGGKRLRGFLVIHAAVLFDVPKAVSLRVAASVECLHAYSLVHDDLPCMDDDALRRGQPTVHVKWDEATAVLAGDALQTEAFALLANLKCPADQRVELIAALAKASGQYGMVGGQAIDIAAESASTPLDLEAITRLQNMKTGALIHYCAEAGAILGQADVAQREALRVYADALGLAFQIRDDLLDVEGDTAQTGKAVHKDADAGKATFVSLLGVEAARNRAADLVDHAIVQLAPFGLKAAPLAEAARFALTRQS